MPAAPGNFGFLTYMQESTGTSGGYLIVNQWGRPLEFRLSSAVQPNRVQQILYGDALPAFLHGELIGKTLVEKSTTPVKAIITDQYHALDLRLRVDLPIAWHSLSVGPPTNVLSIDRNLHLHSDFPQDADAFREILTHLSAIDFAEPFQRVREAMSEARRLGVTQRSLSAAA
jgi:hypothetical protein